jgi:RNA polymerase sigma-70 factor (ECF subfamily)
MPKIERSRGAEWIIPVLDQYEGPLLRYAARLVGDLDAARDVVQDAFLKLCSEDPAVLRDHVAPWLFAVCRNRAMDLFRKEQRMNPLEDAQLEVLESEDPSPSETLERQETNHSVMAALGRLPKHQQEAIRLKFQEGLSYREISQVTGHSISHVGVLIHTGMKTIRERLAHLAAEA